MPFPKRKKKKNLEGPEHRGIGCPGDGPVVVFLRLAWKWKVLLE